GLANIRELLPQFALAVDPNLSPRQRHGHRGQDQHDAESHDQFDQREPALSLAFHTFLYFTVMAVVGDPDTITCPCELRTPNTGIVTALVPTPTPWKMSVTSTPEPLLPGVPGCRFKLTMAVPLSFWIFLVNTGTWPSLPRKSPR